MAKYLRNENAFLRACPHCGGPASIYATHSEAAGMYFVYCQCDICEARGKTYATDENPTLNDWKALACGDAAQAWNMRVCEEVYL